MELKYVVLLTALVGAAVGLVPYILPVILRESSHPFGGEEYKLIEVRILKEGEGRVTINGKEVDVMLLKTLDEWAELTVEATPARGYFFEKWLVNGSGEYRENPLRLRVRGDVTIKAFFGQVQYRVTVWANSSRYRVWVNGSPLDLPVDILYFGAANISLKADDVVEGRVKYRFLYWMVNGSIIANRTVGLLANCSNIEVEARYALIRLGRYVLSISAPFNNTIIVNGTRLNSSSIEVVGEEPYLVTIEAAYQVKIGDLVAQFKSFKVEIEDGGEEVFYEPKVVLLVQENMTVKLQYVTLFGGDVYSVQVLVNGNAVTTELMRHSRDRNFSAKVRTEDSWIGIEGDGAFHLRLVRTWSVIRVMVEKDEETDFRIELVVENGPIYSTTGVAFGPEIDSSREFTVIFHNNPLVVEVKGSVFTSSGRRYSGSFPGVVPLGTLLIEVRNGSAMIRVEVTGQ